MKRYLITPPALLAVIGMYLAILSALVRVTLFINAIPSDLWRSVARAGELILGIGLLLGGTLIATHLAVWLFQPSSEAAN